MNIRPWRAGDEGAVRTIHELMATGYPLPDVNAPLFGLKRVLEADSGDGIGAGAVKPVGECFLWVAQDLPPVLRGRAFCRLMGEARSLAAASGYDELTAWIPPHIEAAFGSPLSRAGWRPSPWQSWSVRI